MVKIAAFNPVQFTYRNNLIFVLLLNWPLKLAWPAECERRPDVHNKPDIKSPLQSPVIVFISKLECFRYLLRINNLVYIPFCGMGTFILPWKIQNSHRKYGTLPENLNAVFEQTFYCWIYPVLSPRVEKMEFFNSFLFTFVNKNIFRGC